MLDEITARLRRAVAGRGDFDRVHVAPSASGDVADDEDPEELFMGLFPRWTVQASIDPSDPHYLDGDDDGKDCEP